MRALFIALLSVTVYINSLGGEFVWDDIVQVLENPFIRDLRNIPSFFTEDLGRYTAFPALSSPYYRPIFLVSYTIDYSLWGLNPFGYHISNILLHALSSLLVYIIALNLLKERTAAFIAGSIFAIHPVHVEVVAWIAGRADLLAALLLFASFYLYTVFRDPHTIFSPSPLSSLPPQVGEEKGGGSYYGGGRGLGAKGRRLALGLSLITYALSLFSKEMAISLPLLLLAYEFSLKKDNGNKGIANKFFYPLLYIIISSVYFLLRVLVMGSNAFARADSPPLDIARIYTTPKIVLDYLRSFIFPVNLKVLYDIPLKDSILDPPVLLSALLLSLIVIAVFLAYHRDRRVFFASLWFLITLLPVLGPAGLTLMADRYLYIPTLGLSLLVGLFLSKAYHLNISWSRYIKLLILLPLIFLFIITLHRNRIWKDEFTYYKKAVEDAPEFAMAHANLGLWYLDRKMYDEAIPILKKATELDPLYPYSWVNLGNAYLQKGLYEEAISEYKKTIEMSPGFAEAYYGFGNAYREMGRMNEAITQWEMAIRFKPEHSEANNNLGNVYLLRGNYREAAERYRTALKGRPLNAEAHYNLAMALEGLGEINEAKVHYQIFLELGQEEYKELVKEVEHKLKSQ